MTECGHTKLTILRKVADARVRCQRCHLSITAAELGTSHCPECYETSGAKRYDFEPVAPAAEGPSRLRCEDCGLMIDAEPQ